jgi:hypothetical protein
MVLVFTAILGAMLLIALPFGELGIGAALLLFLFLANDAPIQRDDVEALLLLCAGAGILASILGGAGVGDIFGAYY